jgi:dTDP-4-amino-4,6-dideoxygalactose transaminase
MFGNPAQLDPLLELGIPVVEDCAQSLGAEYKSRQVGSLGGLATFSFYATKMITTGEGGMILTDDEESHTRLVELRDYDKKALFPTKYNYKMSNLQASLGLSQLSKLHGFIERRKRIASIYNAALSEHDIKLPSATADSKCVFYRYVVKLEKMDQIKEKTHIDGMICERPVFKPLHSDFAAVECPNSDEAYHHALSIPMYPGLSQEEIDYIVTKLEEILRKQG